MKISFEPKDDLEKAKMQNVQDLNAGIIDFDEYQRREKRLQHDLFMPKLMEAYYAGDWESFINIALAVYEVMPDAFLFYDEIPDSLKYDFAIEAYTHHGDSIPAVRKAVRNAAKYGKPILPEEIRDQEYIIVYRAGEENINKCKYRISWTTDIDVANFFFSEYINRHANYLYMASIRPADIIAYTDDRNEKEIMQYRKVYDIQDITPE